MIEQLVRQFLYHPTRLPKDASPPAWTEGAEEVWMRAEDGNDIHGLYWAPPEGSAEQPGPRPTILFLHGNAQTVFEWALVQRELAPAACGLLLIDYPGYGKSSGVPTEASLQAAGRAALSWLVRERETPAHRVVVFGKSLGGGVATELAATHQVRGLVLESTFCSIPDVAKRLIPFMPTSLVFRTERYDSLSRMPRIGCPVLVIHGDRDALIPVAQGRELHARANQPKALHIVEGAGHNDVSVVAGPTYGSWIRNWIDGAILEFHETHAVKRAETQP